MMMRMVLHVSLYVSISNMDNKRLFFLLLFIIYLYTVCTGRPGLFCCSATATTQLIKLVATLTGFIIVPIMLVDLDSVRLMH